MPIVGGLDIHRRQITFDYLDTVTGEVRRGQIASADREHLRAWLAGSPAGRTSRSRWRGARAGGMWPRKPAPRAHRLGVLQRIHAVLFHQGVPVLGEGTLRTEQGVAALRAGRG
jgi:hypothetical protein